MMNSKTMARRLGVGIAAAAIALLLAVTLNPASRAQGLAQGASLAPSPNFSGYEISIENNATYGAQTVKLEFFYGGGNDTVTVASSPAAKIAINGAAVDPARIFFAGGNSLIIYIAPTVGYSSVWSGRITVDIPDMTGITISDGTDIVTPTPITSSDFPETVIPLGATISTSQHPGGQEDATADILTVPNGNGMIHVGLYYVDPVDKMLYPIWNGYPNDDTDPIQVYTYPVFIDNYNPSLPMTELALAKSIAAYAGNDSHFSLTGYSLAAEGTDNDARLTLSDPAGDEQVLYIVIFDDNMLKNLSPSYPQIVADGGILPEYPY
jgi:hypothetical protein